MEIYTFIKEVGMRIIIAYMILVFVITMIVINIGGKWK